MLVESGEADGATYVRTANDHCEKDQDRSVISGDRPIYSRKMHLARVRPSDHSEHKVAMRTIQKNGGGWP
jgi:hypothetical protein